MLVLKWEMVRFLFIAIPLLNESSSPINTGFVDSLVDYNSLNNASESDDINPNSISYLMFARRLTTFQGANQRKSASVSLPDELIHYITEYMHYYDWSSLLDVFRGYRYTTGPTSDSMQKLRAYLLRCVVMQSFIPDYPFKLQRPSPIHIDSLGNIVKIDLSYWSLEDSAIGDLSKLPPTLKKLNLRSNALTTLSTKALPRGLDALDLGNNKMTHLDLRTLPQRLAFLNIGHNPLPHDVDLSALPRRLKKLYLPAIGLKRVDLQSLPAGLEYVDLSDNPLETLNLNIIQSRFGKLKEIYLWGLPDLEIQLPNNGSISPSIGKRQRLPWGTWIDRQYYW